MMKLKISKTMAGKTAVKAFLAVALLAGPAAVPAGDVSAAGVKATAAPTAQSTAAPVMRDNLSKYGLVKDIELPVTVTAGGLSYTLEKIMIYDYNSKDALALRKLYNYSEMAGPITKSKYFIWTKITIKNTSQKLIQQNYKDLNDKWRLFFDSSLKMGEAYAPMPRELKSENNSQKALFDYTLNPGKSLTTYQGYLFQGEFKYFQILVQYNNATKLQPIVNDPEAK